MRHDDKTWLTLGAVSCELQRCGGGAATLQRTVSEYPLLPLLRPLALQSRPVFTLAVGSGGDTLTRATERLTPAV